MFLREFNKEVRYLKGVGPKLSQILEKLKIKTIADLIQYFPRDYVDRSQIDLLKNPLQKDYIHVIARVIAHDYIGWGRKKTLKIIIEDSSHQASLLCFGRNYLKSVLVPGIFCLVSGNFKYHYNELQSSNFEVEPYNEDGDYEKIIPIYPLTTGLTQGPLRRMMKKALLFIKDQVKDELPLYLIKKYNLIHKQNALWSIHFPPDLSALNAARSSLVYEELFYIQLHIARKALKRRVKRKKRIKISFALEETFLKRLPFTLTDDQQKVTEEITKDLFSPYPMSRLLQGDVGCGKTLVAVICSLSIIESGQQVAFMAPTELLAKQHAEKIAKMLEPIGVNIAFLSGGIKKEERKNLLRALSGGSINLLIGTHALFSSDIVFKDLGFVIVDEQHRFGVIQRLAILKKGKNPDLLLMTATPIPRTLALTAFGDLEISTIKSMPAGRKKVITHLTKEGNEKKVYKRIKEEINNGRQAYFVYPLIEDSEKLTLKDAEGMFKKLNKNIFPDFKIGLIHSKISDEEKRLTMGNFSNGSIQILVATSVVEVGVDIPNANCIVIEHAERFGLSALHQLRGRVGRGNYQSYAFLIYSNNLTDDGIKRLKIMMETTDGFRIAEEDLKIRGPGELLGVKQSGFLHLNIANLNSDMNTLIKARYDAFSQLKIDPGLIKPENSVIRDVLLKAPPYSDQFLDGG